MESKRKVGADPPRSLRGAGGEGVGQNGAGGEEGGTGPPGSGGCEGLVLGRVGVLGTRSAGLGQEQRRAGEGQEGTGRGRASRDSAGRDRQRCLHRPRPCPPPAGGPVEPEDAGAAAPAAPPRVPLLRLRPGLVTVGAAGSGGGVRRCSVPVGPSMLTLVSFSPSVPSAAGRRQLRRGQGDRSLQHCTEPGAEGEGWAGLGWAGRGLGVPRVGFPHPSQRDQGQVLPFPSLPSPCASPRPSWGTAGSTLTWGTCCCTPSALRSTPWWRTG